MPTYSAEKRLVSPVVAADPGHYAKAFRGIAEVGFLKLGEQEPYFHVLATTDRKLKNNRWESSYPNRSGCCADHESFRTFFPALAHLARYHLWGVNSGPMHYFANSLYWAKEATKFRDLGRLGEAEKAVNAFKSACGYGLVEGDERSREFTGQVWTWHEDNIRAWLEGRLARLLKRFRDDVEAFEPGLVERARNLGKGA